MADPAIELQEQQPSASNYPFAALFLGAGDPNAIVDPDTGYVRRRGENPGQNSTQQTGRSPFSRLFQSIGLWRWVPERWFPQKSNLEWDLLERLYRYNVFHARAKLLKNCFDSGFHQEQSIRNGVVAESVREDLERHCQYLI